MRNDSENRPSNNYEPFPREALDRSIGARFDEIARRFPDKLAVRTRKHSWRYAELNSRAETLAEAINGHKISRPAPILLLCDHDAPAIAAVLGVLKTGHFYCALDPAAPLAQNKTILQSLTPGALVCDRANLDASEKLAGVAILASRSLMRNMSVSVCMPAASVGREEQKMLTSANLVLTQ